MTYNEKRKDILELCSEDAYGSWEFWSDQDKTEEEAELIVKVINDLVIEKKITPLNKVSEIYKETPLDIIRLNDELKRSIHQSSDDYQVDAERFYWFEATQDGKREDISNRS